MTVERDILVLSGDQTIHLQDLRVGDRVRVRLQSFEGKPMMRTIVVDR